MIKITSFEEGEIYKDYLKSFGEFKSYPHSTEMYGSGYWIKKYYKISDFVKLDNWDIQHGVPFFDEIPFYLKNIKTTVFVFNEIQRANYEANKIKSYVSGSPFILCRKHESIKLEKNRKGTICFPIHSTNEISVIFDWEKYINSLMNLPEQFKPISVCLYFKEIQDNVHLHFINKNIDVYCAGEIRDNDFPLSFYNILKNFKYSCSNTLGSYTYYASEFGVPFFLLKQESSFHNHGNDSIFENCQTIKEEELYKENLEEYQYLTSIFSFENIFDDSKIQFNRNFSAQKLGIPDHTKLINILNLKARIYYNFVKLFIRNIIRK